MKSRADIWAAYWATRENEIKRAHEIARQLRFEEYEREIALMRVRSKFPRARIRRRR